MKFDGYQDTTSDALLAIVGMAGQFPGAANVAQFWQNLASGFQAIRSFSDEELLAAGVDSCLLNDPNYVKADIILEDIDLFDASFFGFSPREAEAMDPQSRLFLQCVWAALEDAAYDPTTYKGLIGVFAGKHPSLYQLCNLYSNPEVLQLVGGLQLSIGNDADALATMTAYKFNLTGPVVSVQTFCSTSLVAAHLACQSLLSYECDLALAGGVAIQIPQGVGYRYQEGGILSPEGECRAFDAQAKGTVFGSGLGVVVLKRLKEALEEGDHIYAVIRGSAVNNDGSMRVSYTAPGLEGQASVILQALGAANVDTRTIGYVETHGTGTLLGDSVELEAMSQAFRVSTDETRFCAIGSVKPGIGHLDRASGVTALIKAALALHYRLLPPSLNFETPNPDFDWESSPFYVNTELKEWVPDGSWPRRAGVSAFGFGGTNAHMVLEEAPELESSDVSHSYHLLLLSAKTENALEAATANLATRLRDNSFLNLADVAYTLQVGRAVFNHRRMVVCRDLEEAANVLTTNDPARVLTAYETYQERPVAFMFSGQGSQYVNMGRGLYQSESLFREQVDLCAELLKPYLGIELSDVLYPQESDVKAAEVQLKETWLTQPALFVIEYALAQLWMAWGIEPAAMIGHSIGEYVAACLAGVFSLEDALVVVAARGRLMHSVPSGAMLSVPLAEADVQSLLDESLVVATVNGPERCAVSGPTEAIIDLERRLIEMGMTVRRLHTSHAFHSPMMDPILEPFVRQVQQVQLYEPQIPYISNVTGTWITTQEATDPAYWARHLRRTVRFADGVSVLVQMPEQVLLEVGPAHTLRTLVQRHPDCPANQVVLSSMRHPRTDADDRALLLHTLGQLWMVGATVDWQGFYQDERRLRVSLPTYPFERQRYWIEAQKDDYKAPVSLSKNPQVTDWFYIPSWKRTLLSTDEPQQRGAHWLVFSDGGSLGTRLVQRIRARGDKVTTVMVGDRFAVDDDTWTIRIAQVGDYKALLKALGERDQKPSGIVHLWNVSSPDEGILDFTGEALERSFYSLLFLVQAIGTQSLNDLRLVVISSGVQRVVGEEPIYPERAALLGPCKVIPKEMSISARSVDIVLPENGSQREAELVDQLVAEIEMDTADSIIAYRGRDRWVQTYEPVTLSGSKEGETGKLCEGGVYLITGGLGGIGLTLARYLAQTVQARLILTSRSGFPEPEAWDTWLATHNPQDRTSLRIQAVLELEALGAEVLVLYADVANKEQMELAVDTACGRFGTIHGVIHAAGLPGGGVIQRKTEQSAAAVMRPKVYGTRVLEAVLRDVSLDFVVLCSSLAVITGDVGQVDYCAANAFLDAFAQAKDGGHNGRMTVSINWDSWAEVGMAVNTSPNYAAGRPQQVFQVVPFSHPILIESYQETDDRKVYRMKLDAAEHWVLSEHLLLDLPTIPGTTYLELARAALADCVPSTQFEIRKALFLEPLRVSRGDNKEAQLILEEGTQGFDFWVMSNSGVGLDGEILWQTHASGHLEPMEKTVPPQYDVEAICARCMVSEETVVAEDVKRVGFITFGPRWFNTPKRINVGHNEVLVWVELDEEYLSDLEDFKLHPALLDIATSSGIMMLGGGRPYLPLLYKHMRVYGNLPAKFYSYVRLKPNIVIGGEIVAFQIALIDERGSCIVDVGEFVMKQVGETAVSRFRETTDIDVPVTAGSRSVVNESSQRDLGDAILPEEGVEAFRRILSQGHLSQVVVSPRHLPTLAQRADVFVYGRVLEEVAQAEVQLAKHPRPNLRTPYVAPRDEVEAKMVAVWQELLGIEKVGIHDNFFELGGDSILALQVTFDVEQAGVRFSPQHIFEYPTVAELATMASPIQATEAEAGSAELVPPVIKPISREAYRIERSSAGVPMSYVSLPSGGKKRRRE